MSRTVTLAIIAVLVNTIPRWLPYDNLYFIGQGISYLLLLAAIRLQCVVAWHKVALTALCGLAINNLLDELFFDPIHCGWNEIVFTIGIILWVIGKLWIRAK